MSSKPFEALNCSIFMLYLFLLKRVVYVFDDDDGSV